MALIVRTYKCDDCGLETDITQDSKEFDAPDCPACEVETNMSGPIPSTTAIGRRTASKSVDQIWKLTQEGSEIRAEAAGDPSLKITDQKDGFYGGLRQGDTTAARVQNDVTRYADATGFQMWGQGGGGTALSPETAAAIAKSSRGRAKQGPGMAQLNAITGGGPMQFPTRQRPKAG